MTLTSFEHFFEKNFMVYGIQNNRLGPLVNEFLTVLKTLYYSPRKLKNTGEKLLEKTKNKLGLSCTKLRAVTMIVLIILAMIVAMILRMIVAMIVAMILAMIVHHLGWAPLLSLNNSGPHIPLQTF